MDFSLLKTQALISQDFTTLTSVPAGLVSRRAIKIAVLAVPGANLTAIQSASPVFFNDPDFDLIDINSELTQGILAAMLSGGAINSAELAAINALGTVQVPRWQALGFSECPQAGDIAYALSLP